METQFSLEQDVPPPSKVTLVLLFVKGKVAVHRLAVRGLLFLMLPHLSSKAYLKRARSE